LFSVFLQAIRLDPHSEVAMLNREAALQELAMLRKKTGAQPRTSQAAKAASAAVLPMPRPGGAKL